MILLPISGSRSKGWNFRSIVLSFYLHEFLSWVSHKKAHGVSSERSSLSEAVPANKKCAPKIQGRILNSYLVMAG